MNEKTKLLRLQLLDVAKLSAATILLGRDVETVMRTVAMIGTPEEAAAVVELALDFDRKLRAKILEMGLRRGTVNEPMPTTESDYQPIVDALKGVAEIFPLPPEDEGEGTIQ